MVPLSTMCINQPHLKMEKDSEQYSPFDWLLHQVPPGLPCCWCWGCHYRWGLPLPLLPGWPPCPPKLPWPPWPPPPCGIYHTECWVNQDLKSVSSFSAFTVCIPTFFIYFFKILIIFMAVWNVSHLPDACSILVSAMLVPLAFNKHQLCKWNIFILLPFDCRFQQLVSPSFATVCVGLLKLAFFFIMHVFGSSSLGCYVKPLQGYCLHPESKHIQWIKVCTLLLRHWPFYIR